MLLLLLRPLPSFLRLRSRNRAQVKSSEEKPLFAFCYLICVYTKSSRRCEGDLSVGKLRLADAPDGLFCKHYNLRISSRRRKHGTLKNFGTSKPVLPFAFLQRFQNIPNFVPLVLDPQLKLYFAETSPFSLTPSFFIRLYFFRSKVLAPIRQPWRPGGSSNSRIIF